MISAIAAHIRAMMLPVVGVCTSMKSFTASIIIAGSDTGDGKGSISKIIRFSLTIGGAFVQPFIIGHRHSEPIV